MTESLRIVIADDDAIVRSGLANLLSYQDGISIVATAANGAEALTAISRAQPDVALIDVDMPILDGISTAKILSQEYPRIAIVMLTAFDHEESLAKSLAATQSSTCHAICAQSLTSSSKPNPTKPSLKNSTSPKQRHAPTSANSSQPQALPTAANSPSPHSKLDTSSTPLLVTH